MLSDGLGQYAKQRMKKCVKGIMTEMIIRRGKGAGKCFDSGRVWSWHMRAVPAHMESPTKKMIG